MGYTNWAGNVQYRTDRVHRPRTVDEVRTIVARSRKLRVIGTRHSFNEIADTDGDHVSLEHLIASWRLNPRQRVTPAA